MDIVKTKMLLTITDKNKNRKIINLYKKHNVKYSLVLNGSGTASGATAVRGYERLPWSRDAGAALCHGHPCQWADQSGDHGCRSHSRDHSLPQQG